MTLEDDFVEVRRVAALLAAHGRPECRRRLVEVLDSGMSERQKLGVLCYEVGLMLEMPRTEDPERELAKLRERLDQAASA